MRNALKALASVAVHDPGDIRIIWGRGQCAEILRPHYGHGHSGHDYGCGANLYSSKGAVRIEVNLNPGRHWVTARRVR